MNTPAANKVRCHCLLRSQNYATTRFLALGSTPPRVNRGDRLERRPPVGTARRRRANHVLPTGGMSRTCTTAPAEVPVAVRTTPLFEVRPVRCAARSGAGPHRENWPEVGVPLPARRSAWWRAAETGTVRHAGSEQSSLPLFFARSAVRHHAQNRGDRLERRPPVGTARRRRANHVLPTGGMSRTCTTAPAEVPVAVRTTPLFEVRPVRCAARSGAGRHRENWPEVGVPLPARRSAWWRAAETGTVRHVGSEQSSLPLFFARSAVRHHAQNRGDRLERRPPVGTARRRRANHVPPTGGMSRTCTTAPAEVPVAVRTTPLFEVRPVRCAARSGAGPHRENWPEVGVPLPARRSAWWRAAETGTVRHAGSEQSSLPLFFARSAVRHHAQNRGDRLERRPPVGTARRRRANHVPPTGGMSRTCTTAPAEVPVAVRTTPLFEVRPVRCAARSGAGPHRENWPEVGVPLPARRSAWWRAAETGTVRHAGSEQSSLPLFFARSAVRHHAQNRGDRLERRPPVGTARRRRANHVPPTGGMSRTCTTAPAEVPVAVRTTPLFKVRLVRCAARSGAGPHRENWPEVGVPLPARRSAWWRAAETGTVRHAGSEQSSLPLFFAR